MEAMVAVAVLAILVLGMSRTNVSALLSRKTLNERRLFNERVSSAASVLAITDSCSCNFEYAYEDPLNGGIPASLVALQREVTPGNAGLGLNLLAYFPAIAMDPISMESRCWNPPPGPVPAANVIFQRGRSIQDPNQDVSAAQAAAGTGAGQVHIPVAGPAGLDPFGLRNVKYGGQILDQLGRSTNCAVYVADLWIEARRTQRAAQAGMSATIPVSFVVRDNGPPPATTTNFRKCYSKPEWERHFQTNPRNVAGDPPLPVGVTASAACN
jgi:hypothetical protein